MKIAFQILIRIVLFVGYVVAMIGLIRGTYSSPTPERIMILSVGMLVVIVLAEVWGVTGRKQ